MNMKKFVLGAVAALSLVSATNHLEAKVDDGSFYAGIHYNGEFIRKQDVTSISTSMNTSKFRISPEAIEYKMGHLGAIEVGYAYSNSPRVAMEFGYASVKPKDSMAFLDYTSSEDSNDEISVSIKDGIKTMYGMLNVYYDIVENELPFAPYLGAGVGLARQTFVDVHKYSMAYQLKAGVTVPIVPGIRAYVGYTYLGVTEGDGYKDVAVEAEGSVTVDKATYKLPYAAHSVSIGLITAM